MNTRTLGLLWRCGQVRLHPNRPQCPESWIFFIFFCGGVFVSSRCPFLVTSIFFVAALFVWWLLSPRSRSNFLCLHQCFCYSLTFASLAVKFQRCCHYVPTDFDLPGLLAPQELFSVLCFCFPSVPYRSHEYGKRSFQHSWRPCMDAKQITLEVA